MSGAGILAGCSPLCLLGVVLYGLWFWVPVALLASSLVVIAVFGKLRRPWFGWFVSVGGVLFLLLLVGLAGFPMLD